MAQIVEEKLKNHTYILQFSGKHNAKFLPEICSEIKQQDMREGKDSSWSTMQ